MRDLSPANSMEPEGLRLREVSTAGASNEGDGKTSAFSKINTCCSLASTLNQ